MQLKNLVNVLQKATQSSFIKSCIYRFSLWDKFFVFYALKAKKIYQHCLNAGLLEFHFFWLRGSLTKPFRTLLLFFRVIGKTTGLIFIIILLKKFLSASAITKMTWQDVPHSSLCSGVKECGTKRAHNFLFPKSSFRIRRTTVLGMFKDSAIILEGIQQSFFNKSARAAMFTSV